jgi:two-component sensor histidine kinase/CheY-like chemotaxis protein
VHSITVLNVDDHEPSRYARTRLLVEAGYDVREAATGHDALAMVDELRPSIVLLDVHLPDISGLEVCRRIRAHSEYAHTPILQITASAGSDRQKVAGLDNGADGYLVEPVDPNVLLATVRALLRMRYAEQELQRVNAALYESNAALEQANAEMQKLVKNRELLVQEIHHRVKNNLQMIVSLLRLQARHADHPKVIEALSEAGGRVQSMARLHERLYGSSNLAETEFGAYLRGLAGELSSLYGRPNISLNVMSEDVVLGMESAIPLGLIANELIVNSFKHAFPADRAGQVIVSLGSVRDGPGPGPSPVETFARLRVEDDGIGAPPGFDFNTSNSLGLRLVRLLGEQLQAQVAAQTVTGVSFTVTFPVRSASQ